MVKKTVNSILASLFNIKVVRARQKAKNPPFLDIEHPLEACYVNKGFPFVMNMPLDRGRVWNWYPTNKDSLCPFTVCAKAYLNDNIGFDGVENILSVYAKSIPQHDGNAALGLEGHNKTFSDGEHSKKITLPWDNRKPNEYYEAWHNWTIEENRKYGHNKLDFFGSGNVSSKKVELEALRTVSLIDSLSNEGYVFNPKDCIGCDILVTEHDWRWSASSGQHRAAILSAMKETYLPLLVKQIIRRDDVAYWPNVKSGLFSKEAALQIFDRRFFAKPPPLHNKWISLVDSTVFNNHIVETRGRL